jgi:hypothetical protein
MNTSGKIGLITGYTIFELIRNIVLPSQVDAQNSENNKSHTYKLDTNSLLISDPKNIESKFRLSGADFPLTANYNDIRSDIVNAFSWIRENANSGNIIYIKDAPKDARTGLENDVLFAVDPSTNTIIPNMGTINYQSITNALLSLGNIPDGTNSGDGFFLKRMQEINNQPSVLLSIYNPAEPQRGLYTRFEHLMGFLKLKAGNTLDEKIMKDIIATYAALPENGYNVKLDPKNIRIITKQFSGYVGIEDIIYSDSTGKPLFKDVNGKDIPATLVARKYGKNDGNTKGLDLDYQTGHIIITVGTGANEKLIPLALKYVPRDAVLGQDLLEISRGINQLTNADADSVSRLPYQDLSLSRQIIPSSTRTSFVVGFGLEHMVSTSKNNYLDVTSDNGYAPKIVLSAEVESKGFFLFLNGNGAWYTNGEFTDNKGHKNIGNSTLTKFEANVLAGYNLLPGTSKFNVAPVVEGTLENISSTQNYDPGTDFNPSTFVVSSENNLRDILGGAGIEMSYVPFRNLPVSAKLEYLRGTRIKEDMPSGPQSEKTDFDISGARAELGIEYNRFDFNVLLEKSLYNPNSHGSRGFTHNIERQFLEFSVGANIWKKLDINAIYREENLKTQGRTGKTTGNRVSIYLNYGF